MRSATPIGVFRPDYGVSVEGVTMGYIEVKAPGRPIHPEEMTGHDLEQWDRQKDLPNLIYTNGTKWLLYRDGKFVEEAVLTDDSLADVATRLRSNARFETVLRTFLAWEAAAIASVYSLVRAIAPLTRLLRGEVLDQLAAERKRVDCGAQEDEQPFIGLAKDSRRLLFPHADDHTFADGYAQAVTFALLLARTSGIDFKLIAPQSRRPARSREPRPTGEQEARGARSALPQTTAWERTGGRLGDRPAGWDARHAAGRFQP
jgi:hypothetical protein